MSAVIDFRIRCRPLEGGDEALMTFLRDEYQPALSRQDGFLGSSVRRSYPPDLQHAIGATDDGFPVELEFRFATEEHRLRWAESPDHEQLWPRLVGLTSDRTWCGYRDSATTDGVGS